jgi:nucleoside triphosphate pyrophosphatase
MTRLVLASGSTTRARLLSAAGIAFDAVSPHVDEEAIKESLLAEHATPRDIADALAALKASKVSMSRPGVLVVGADLVLVFENELISKCADMDSARTLLRRLSGHTHELIAGVVVAKDGAIVWRHIARAQLSMRKFSDAFLDDYLAAGGDEILSSVGCYHLEYRGIQLFSNIVGDYFTVLGLPMVPLVNALRELGALPQ